MENLTPEMDGLKTRLKATWSAGDFGRIATSYQAGAADFIARLGIGDWSLELLRRATVLIARDGHVAAIWSRVKIRGHAAEVLEMARALAAEPHPGIAKP